MKQSLRLHQEKNVSKSLDVLYDYVDELLHSGNFKELDEIILDCNETTPLVILMAMEVFVRWAGVNISNGHKIKRLLLNAKRE